MRNAAQAACGVGVLLALLAGTVYAREGFYLGGGVASQSVSGDLDGSHLIVSSSGTVAIVAGKPASGTGLAILVGYGFTPVLSVEYLFASTSNKATSSKVNRDSDTTLDAGLIGLRVNFPATESWEVFARLGISSGIVEYKNYALHGSVVGNNFVYTSTSSATFTGGGVGYGLGAEWFLEEKVGLGASYSVLSVDFDKAEGGGVAGTLPNKLSATISQLALTITYNFK